MFFTVALYSSLAVFSAGVLFKVSTWFRYRLNRSRDDGSLLPRLSDAAKGVCTTVFSVKILIVLKVFFLDVLLQRRILSQDPLRWLMHMLIFVGFMMLLLMHGLDKILTAPLFPNYYPTLNPFLFLRDFFGVMVFAGLGIAVYRRFFLKLPRFASDAVDVYAIAILAVVMISGFLLEATKMTSYTSYRYMVDDYAGTDDEEELAALESLWVQKFGLVSPNIKGPFTEAVIEQGMEINEGSCMECHSSPQWAFGGFLTAKVISPVALTLDKINFQDLLRYIHLLACFMGLAYLPFSKLFHIFTTPLSLFSNAVMDRTSSAPSNIATRQVLELDACTRCGTCSLNCSVAVSYESVANADILPSIKIRTLKSIAKKDALSRRELVRLQEGLFLCTNCLRCTTVCPAGINLQDLWFDTRQTVLQKGNPEPLVLSVLSYHRGLNRDRIDKAAYQEVITKARSAVVDPGRHIGVHDAVTDASIDDRFKKRVAASLPGDTGAYCFSCTTCTASCPVVRNFDHPMEALGLLPHQMIRAANFGLGDMIFESTMLWSCLGCYACQENCPQGVRIADLFYELKNLAMDLAKERTLASS